MAKTIITGTCYCIIDFLESKFEVRTPLLTAQSTRRGNSRPVPALNNPAGSKPGLKKKKMEKKKKIPFLRERFVWADV